MSAASDLAEVRKVNQRVVVNIEDEDFVKMKDVNMVYLGFWVCDCTTVGWIWE